MDELWGLIIEDDADLASAFTEVLHFSGLRMELIQNGSLALEILANSEPDLVLLDLHLPEVSGPEILDYIRNDRRLAGTKVVIVTADAVRAKQLEKTADLVMIKPIRFSDLLSLADRLFPPPQNTPATTGE
jgi:DNA-binding response OmpR family regulator